jgi:hypothetical protein
MKELRADRAMFSGVAGFGGATFSGIAWFEAATFSGEARFDGRGSGGIVAGFRRQAEDCRPLACDDVSLEGVASSELCGGPADCPKPARIPVEPVSGMRM